jgi:hypothetical protein
MTQRGENGTAYVQTKVAIIVAPPEMREAGATAFANLVMNSVAAMRLPAQVSTPPGLSGREEGKLGQIDREIPRHPDLGSDVDAV